MKEYKRNMRKNKGFKKLEDDNIKTEKRAKLYHIGIIINIIIIILVVVIFRYYFY